MLRREWPHSANRRCASTSQSLYRIKTTDHVTGRPFGSSINLGCIKPHQPHTMHRKKRTDLNRSVPSLPQVHTCSCSSSCRLLTGRYKVRHTSHHHTSRHTPTHARTHARSRNVRPPARSVTRTYALQSAYSVTHAQSYYTAPHTPCAASRRACTRMVMAMVA